MSPTTKARASLPALWTAHDATFRVRVLFFVVLAGLSLVLILRNFNAYQFGYTPDSAEYTILAHSLLSGPTFGMLNAPGAPLPWHFPIGYPILILPFVLFTPTQFDAPKFLSLVATLLSGGILFWGWCSLVPGFSDRWRFAVTAMFVLAPLTLTHALLVLSEAPFTMLLLLTCFLGARLLKTPQPAGLWVAWSVSAFFMAVTRSIGLICLTAILVYLLVRLRSRAVRGICWMLGVWLVMVALVCVLTPIRPYDFVPQEYVADFLRYLNRFRLVSTPLSAMPKGVLPLGPNFIVTHIHQDLRHVLFLTGGGTAEQGLITRTGLPWLASIPGFLLLGFLALGNVSWLRRTLRGTLFPLSLFQWVGLVYLPVVFSWVGGGERLFYPIQPQLYLAMLLGIVTVGHGVTRLIGALRRKRGGIHPGTPRLAQGAVWFGVLAAAWLLLATVRDVTLRTSKEMVGDLSQRTDAVQAHTAPNTILLSDFAALDYLASGRHTLALPELLTDPADLYAYLRANRVDYIVLALDTGTGTTGLSSARVYARDTRPAILALERSGQLRRVYTNAFPLLIDQAQTVSE